MGSSTFMHGEGELSLCMEKGELGLFPLLMLGDGGCSGELGGEEIDVVLHVWPSWCWPVGVLSSVPASSCSAMYQTRPYTQHGAELVRWLCMLHMELLRSAPPCAQGGELSHVSGSAGWRVRELTIGLYARPA
ncbi:hypothetical protein Dimus_033019 [Dionaea muscipula]